MVLVFIWQDQAVVKGMSTVHTGEGYIVQPRRRPRDSSTITASTKSIFNIPRSSTFVVQEVKDYAVSKLALPVTLPIYDYNHYINGVNITDQLR